LTTDQLLNAAMLEIAAVPGSLFIGQNVRYDGAATYKALEGIPDDQRVEFPVAEEMQCGYCVGLSLLGFLPVCIYPRMNFMWRAVDQLVSHLDKMELMSRGQFVPKIIIRTRVGATKPLNAGPQHVGNFSDAFRLMLTNVDVCEIFDAKDISRTYRMVLESKRSTIVVEAW
jgi:pyruvate/2-oxoglutarate/acetoin dehydrogenase E1 component